jgi:enoyl-CoA hydratase/carnithine racemase
VEQSLERQLHGLTGVEEVETSAAGRAVRKLASKPLASLLETKRLMKMGSAAEVAQRMNQESEIFGRMLGEAAAKEAFTAFMDKRLPDFSKV